MYEPEQWRRNIGVGLDNTTVLAIDCDGARVGAMLRMKRCVIDDFRVTDFERRRRGLGRRGLEVVEGYMRSHGCDKVILKDVMEDARGFWRKMGYIEDYRPYGRGWQWGKDL